MGLIVFCLFFIGVFGSPVFAGCFILTLWETVRQARKRKAAHGGFPIGWLAATVLSAAFWLCAGDGWSIVSRANAGGGATTASPWGKAGRDLIGYCTPTVQWQGAACQRA